jgi:hypothetical protein
MVSLMQDIKPLSIMTEAPDEIVSTVTEADKPSCTYPER